MVELSSILFDVLPSRKVVFLFLRSRNVSIMWEIHFRGWNGRRGMQKRFTEWGMNLREPTQTHKRTHTNPATSLQPLTGINLIRTINSNAQNRERGKGKKSQRKFLFCGKNRFGVEKREIFTALNENSFHSVSRFSALSFCERKKRYF